QYSHVDHSELPPVAEQDSVLYVGQHSMQKPALPGSGLDANQHSVRNPGSSAPFCGAKRYYYFLREPPLAH
ncbi:hypothetical protein RA280_46260, partial [Cupriavidus sp. CV2]|uniref:hypothetical protein n=1 Tax=Cupriavidus ulmosensis TaxID=3065913 RepID=UPI00296AABC5